MADNTARLTSAVSSLPELLEKKKRIDTHTNIAMAILENIKVLGYACSIHEMEAEVLQWHQLLKHVCTHTYRMCIRMLLGAWMCKGLTCRSCGFMVLPTSILTVGKEIGYFL